jgi:hypothetical protein
MIKRIPASMNGIPSIRIFRRLAPTEPVLLKFIIKTKMLHAMPITVRIMPPGSSHFQAIISTTTKVNEGRRCKSSSPIFCHTVLPGLKESNANMLINRIARIHRIRGVH